MSGAKTASLVVKLRGVKISPVASTRVRHGGCQYTSIMGERVSVPINSF